MSPRIVLVGLPGSGKTTIGTRLAHALSVELLDTDELIAQDQGMPCGEVFETYGESEFRRIEARIVAEALKSSGVVSLGGGAVVTPSTRELLQGETVVYLNVSVDEGARRTASNTTRPLLNVANPRARMAELFAERSAFYTEVSNFMVCVDGKRPQNVVAEILAFMDDDRELAALTR